MVTRVAANRQTLLLCNIYKKHMHIHTPVDEMLLPQRVNCMDSPNT